MGFSLMEMLIVVVIIGLTTLWVFPRGQRMLEHTQVRGARSSVVNMINSAKLAARQNNSDMVFEVAGNMISVHPPGLPAILQQNLRSEYSVSVTSGDLTIDFDKRGLVMGGLTNRIVVAKSGFSDSVKVDNYGRVRR
jgi:prepilin-type N-terminal cleavage/methylation domain-containing protein